MTDKFYKNKIFVILLTIIIVLNSGYALTTVYNFSLTWLNLFMVLILSIPFIKIIINNKSIVKYSLLIIFMTGIFTTMVFYNFDPLNQYISYLIMIVLVIQITTLYSFDEIIGFFIKVITFLAILSLIFHFSINKFEINFPIVVNQNGANYGNGILHFYREGDNSRNMGIFWEPGLFASFISMSIVFLIIDKNFKKRIPLLFVLYIALLTTMSSAGYVLLVLSVLLMLSIKINNIKRISFNLKFLINIIMLLIAILFFLKSDNIMMYLFPNNEFILKLLSDNVVNSSRFRTLKVNWSLFIESPFYGKGIKEMSHLVTPFNAHDTTTSIGLLATFGIFGFIYTLIIIMGVIKIKKVDIFPKIIMLIVFLIIVNKEPHHKILSTWLLFFVIFFNTTWEKTTKKDDNHRIFI